MARKKKPQMAKPKRGQFKKPKRIIATGSPGGPHTPGAKKRRKVKGKAKKNKRKRRY